MTYQLKSALELLYISLNRDMLTAANNKNNQSNSQCCAVSLVWNCFDDRKSTRARASVPEDDMLTEKHATEEEETIVTSAYLIRMPHDSVI